MAAVVSIAYTATPLAANTKLIIEATPPISPGISFVPRSRYRQLLVTAAAAASPAVVSTAYVAKFGSPPIGKQVFFRLTVITVDGQRSAPMTVAAIVA